jgi:hypothetical protein
MNKRFFSLLAPAAALCLAATACSNKAIDTAKVRAAFAAVSNAPRQQLDEALSDIENSNYVAALKPLRTVAYSVKMDASQRKIFEDLVAKVKARAEAQK